MIGLMDADVETIMTASWVLAHVSFRGVMFLNFPLTSAIYAALILLDPRQAVVGADPSQPPSLELFANIVAFVALSVVLSKLVVRICSCFSGAVSFLFKSTKAWTDYCDIEGRLGEDLDALSDEEYEAALERLLGREGVEKYYRSKAMEAAEMRKKTAAAATAAGPKASSLARSRAIAKELYGGGPSSAAAARTKASSLARSRAIAKELYGGGSKS
jgi:hypothetical protein